jgi:glycosyltransferase involved in cell wall biosynthesis
VFPTQAAADLVRQRIPIPEERVRIVPHGIDAAAFAATRPEPPGVSYLFLPAAVEPHKNVQALIECLPLVSDPGLEAWIAGSTATHPPYATQMRALAEQRGVAQRVRFLGPVPYQEMLGLHRGARALVFPSFLESFGHPLLEAMLAGTPVVAADIPALREVAGDAALYFDPHRPADLARAVVELGREPEATRARVERGRTRAAEFSWKRSADRLCAVFEEALAAAG